MQLTPTFSCRRHRQTATRSLKVVIEIQIPCWVLVNNHSYPSVSRESGIKPGPAGKRQRGTNPTVNYWGGRQTHPSHNLARSGEIYGTYADKLAMTASAVSTILCATSSSSLPVLARSVVLSRKSASFSIASLNFP